MSCLFQYIYCSTLKNSKCFIINFSNQEKAVHSGSLLLFSPNSFWLQNSDTLEKRVVCAENSSPVKLNDFFSTSQETCNANQTSLLPSHITISIIYFF